MASVYLPDRRTAGTPDPAEVITATLNGVTYRAGRRTVVHLAWTDDALRRDGKWLRIIQPPYNRSVAASAGTHDYDGCVDVEVEGATWSAAQFLLRDLGWAAWYRPHTPGLWGDHIHMVSLGCPGPVGIYVPGQVADYYAHRSGLKGHAPDNTWHPADIASTVFDYPRWLAERDDMPSPKDWTAEDWAAVEKNLSKPLVKAFWDAAVDGANLSARKVLERLAKAFDRNGKPKS